MIELDGSHMEGGGQMIRTALALSAIIGKPFRATNIRANRPQPGLKAQHLHCIKALQELCSAKVTDAHLGSETITFIPGPMTAKTLSVDIGTAGSITLLLQSLLLPCLLAPKPIRLKLQGGTDVSWSMSYDYFYYVFLPSIKSFGEIECRMERRGFYPKGGGKVDIKIKQYPKPFPPLYLVRRGKLMEITGISHASLDLENAEVAQRQAKAAHLKLAKLNVPVKIDSSYAATLSTGSCITLWAKYLLENQHKGHEVAQKTTVLGADALGERGKRSEQVGLDAAQDLMHELESGVCVDLHLADNLIPFLGMAGGAIEVSKITSHTKANIFVTELFLECKFTIVGTLISCNRMQEPKTI